jgi:hypothetical protein
VAAKMAEASEFDLAEQRGLSFRSRRRGGGDEEKIRDNYYLQARNSMGDVRV